MPIFDPITMRPLTNDEGDAALLEAFHRTGKMLVEALTDDDSTLILTGAIGQDEHGKESLLLCIMDNDPDEPLAATPVAVCLLADGPYGQRTYVEAFNAALMRRVESDALRRVTDRIERDQAEHDLAEEINSIVIDTTATEEAPDDPAA